MISLKINLSVWMLATWLVVLQVLSPFVHAHIDTGDHADQANGLHLHTISFKASDKAFDQDKHNLSVNEYALDAHIVVIEKGLIQQLELPSMTAALIAVFIFYVLQTIPPRLRPQKQFKCKPIYQHSSLNPRAPPTF